MGAGRQKESTEFLAASSNCRLNRFDQDELRQLFADCQAGVANLTDEVRLAGDEPDDLVFPKTYFAKPMLRLRRRTKLPDSD